MMGPSGRHSVRHAPPPSIADVEVSELMLDDDVFSTTFGSLTTQFDGAELVPEVPDDPWSSRRRLD
jgi:hypothetical protein